MCWLETPTVLTPFLWVLSQFLPAIFILRSLWHLHSKVLIVILKLVSVPPLPSLPVPPSSVSLIVSGLNDKYHRECAGWSLSLPLTPFLSALSQFFASHFYPPLIGCGEHTSISPSTLCNTIDMTQCCFTHKKAKGIFLKVLACESSGGSCGTDILFTVARNCEKEDQPQVPEHFSNKKLFFNLQK